MFGVFAGFFALTVALFSYKTALFIDPDFGWQLRTGQYIIDSGFPQTDPFSYTMPDYPVIPHSWLSDIGIALVFPHIGYLGLSIVLSIILVFTIFMLALKTKSSLFAKFAPLLLALTAIFPYASVRPQTVGWLLFSILLLLVYNKNLWEKYRLATPFLIWIWAQFHGSFAVGLVLLAIKGFDAKNSKFYVRFLAFPTLLTFINPYGLGLWREVFTTFAHVGTRIGINEWEPLITQLYYFHVPILALSGVLFVKFFKKYTQTEKIVFLLFLAIALSSGKFFPLWILVSIPIMIRGFAFLEKDISHIKNAVERLKKVYIGLIILAIITAAVYIPHVVKKYKLISEDAYFPRNAITFLQENLPEGNIFALFGWGGYLDWKLPEKKVFIDGRMPHWKDEQGSILQRYHDIATGKSNFEPISKQYNITMILIPTEDEKFDLLKQQLAELGWHIAYEDSIATIYSEGQSF